MQANPANTWGQLKEQLAVRFSDVTDPQMALSMLRSVKQKQGENIEVYAERILSLAEVAFGNGGDAVERQLIDIFVDALLIDQLKLKIVRINLVHYRVQWLFAQTNKILGQGSACHIAKCLNPWKLTTSEVNIIEILLVQEIGLMRREKLNVGIVVKKVTFPEMVRLKDRIKHQRVIVEAV